MSAFVAALVLTPIMAWIASRLGVVATPKADRWHKGRVPLLGGVAVCVAAIGVTVGWLGGRAAPAGSALMAGAIMFAVGLLDDLIGMKPNTKLTGQIAVACFVVILQPSPHWTGLHAVDTIITILWIVGITNALNLLDNMDGLCAGVGAIAAAAFALGVAHTDPPAAIYAAALAGAAAGFLVFNFQPASIFMGDSGSLFLGASLAVLGINVEPSAGKTGILSTMAVPVLLMAIPIFDTTFVTVSRKLAGRSASTGGRDHTSHRLVALGFSERQAVLMCYALAAAAGATGVVLRQTSLPDSNILIGLLLITLLLLGVHLGRVRVYGGADYSLLKRNRYTPLLVDVMYKRRIAEVLLDLLLVTLAYYAAYVIRFDVDLPRYYDQFERSLPIVIGSQLVMFFVVGLYRGVWRYMSVADLTTYGKAVAGGTIASVIAIVYIYRFEGYSRGVFIIDAMALTLLIIGSRASFRVFGELAARYGVGGRPVIVYGAGDGAVLLIRELRNNRAHGFRAAALIDDDPTKQRKRILGVPVAGSGETLGEAIARLQAEAVIISTTKLTPQRFAAVQNTCYESGTVLLQLDFRLNALSPAPTPRRGATE